MFTEVKFICISCVQSESTSVCESIKYKVICPCVCPVYMSKQGMWAGKEIWDFFIKCILWQLLQMKIMTQLVSFPSCYMMLVVMING